METQTCQEVSMVKYKCKLINLNSKKFKIKLTNLKGKLLSLQETSKDKKSIKRMQRITSKELNKHWVKKLKVLKKINKN